MRPRAYLLSCLLTPLLWGAVARAETSVTTAPSVVAVRAGAHGTYDRVVFDLSANTTYKIERAKEAATIRFAAQGHPSLKDLPTAHLARLKEYGTSTDSDGHFVFTFRLPASAILRDSHHGSSIVLDVLDGAASPPAKKAEAANLAPAPKAAPPVLVTPSTLPDLPVNTPPAAPPPDLTPSPKPPAPIVAAPESVPVVKNTGPALPDLSEKPLLVASLDPHAPVRIVAYERGGYGYLLFDRKITLSAAALADGQPKTLVDLQPLELTKVTGFRFVVPRDAELRATRTGTVWQIFLTKQRAADPVSASLLAQPDFALGARFLLPQANAPQPIPLTDPVIGDDLILVPLAESEVFSADRRLADFKILHAAQGLVIKPLTDKLVVRAVSDGIEITADGGLKLSTAHDTGASQQSSQKAKAAAAGKSMFDFATWRGKTDESFTQTRQRRQQIIVDVPEAERNRARLELAHFYFAYGNGIEALAVLDQLAKQIPDLRSHSDFLAITGASKILAYRAEDGLKDLDAANFKDQPEIELWQAVGLAELRNWMDAEEKFAATESYLSGYPEPFFSRFSVLAIESAFAAGKDKEGADWLDRFEAAPHSDSAEPAIAYLHGVIHAKAGRAAAASDAWKKTAASNDRLYKIRAELALIDLGVSTGSLSPLQAADQLEALRFGWRGDDLEVDILHRLGHFYVDAKNVKAGLGIFGRAVQLYPNSPITPEIRAEMSNTFEDVFLGSLGKDLSPLDAMTIYQQYKGLMPKGEDGDSVIRNLSERLVAIDLLDQAAELLEDLVKNRLHGEEKTRLGTRLAAIRLLDHKPDDALAALDFSKDGDTTPHLETERLLLRARALSLTNHLPEAMALLKDKQDEPALRLHADIAMHAQKWEDAAATLGTLVGPPPKAGEQIPPIKIDWIINEATALALSGDQTGLDKLAIDFGPAMAGTPKNDVFRLITKAEKSGQLRDIAAAQSSLTEVDMFRGFLDTYRKAAPPPKKEEGKK